MHFLKVFHPIGAVLFPSSHYIYNYKLQFFDFLYWRLSSSLPEWVGITFATNSSILHQIFCHKLMIANGKRGKSIKRSSAINYNLCSREQGWKDCTFSNQTSQFGQILKCLLMKDVGKFYGHLVYFTAILYILWTFGIFWVNFRIFIQFWYVVPRKIWQPRSGVYCFIGPHQTRHKKVRMSRCATISGNAVFADCLFAL
jgi:hypothetical protein